MFRSTFIPRGEGTFAVLRPSFGVTCVRLAEFGFAFIILGCTSRGNMFEKMDVFRLLL
jgi:hypothetical protein